VFGYTLISHFAMLWLAPLLHTFSNWEHAYPALHGAHGASSSSSSSLLVLNGLLCSKRLSHGNSQTYLCAI
jgi:hypothetical protein